MNKNAKNFGLVFSAKIIILIIGVISGFLIPKYLGIEQYGFYQIFLLYVGYVGLFHFGFNDGIYLKYGNYNLEELPKKEFRGYFKFLLKKQLVIMAIGIIIFYFIFKNERQFIMIAVMINLILVNFMSYFYFISQITRNFKLYSLIIILQKVLALIPLVVVLLGLPYFEIFVIGQLLINSLLLCIYFLKYRDLCLGSSVNANKVEIYKLGIPLLIANFIAMLILTADKQFIDIFFTKNDLAIYSFAVALLSLILILFDSVYQVIYPSLKRAKKEKYKDIYLNMSNIIMWLALLGISAYFVIEVIVNVFLPDYIESLPIYAILIVGIALRAENSMVKKSLMLADQKQNTMFIVNIFVLIVAVILNTIASIIFGTLISIAMASLITFLIWYIILDVIFIKWGYPIRVIKYIYLAIILTLYSFLIYNNINSYTAFIIYLLGFSLILLFEFKNIKTTYRYILKKIKK